MSKYNTLKILSSKLIKMRTIEIKIGLFKRRKLQTQLQNLKWRIFFHLKMLSILDTKKRLTKKQFMKSKEET